MLYAMAWGLLLLLLIGNGECGRIGGTESVEGVVPKIGTYITKIFAKDRTECWVLFRGVLL